MKIGILIDHPTQFEGPFFRFAAQDRNHSLRVIYINPRSTTMVYDPELGFAVNWGIDLLDGYEYAVMPCNGRIKWILDELKHQEYDLLIINGYNNPVYVFAALIGRLLGIRLGLRLDTVPFQNQSPRRLLTKRFIFLGLSRVFSRFFPVGSLTRSFLDKMGIAPDRIFLFSYAIDSDYFRAASKMDSARRQAKREHFGLPIESPILLSVAKFNPRESPWDLLKALPALTEWNFSVLLVGDGIERQALESYIEPSNTQVVFAGYIPYPELPSIYGLADVFVHPGADEPWGVSVAEAMACGLPVVASSRVGSAHDLVMPGKNGFIYKSGDVDDLASKLKEAIMMIAKSDEVRLYNDQILARWDYGSTWQAIIKAGERA